MTLGIRVCQEITEQTTSWRLLWRTGSAGCLLAGGRMYVPVRTPDAAVLTLYAISKNHNIHHRKSNPPILVGRGLIPICCTPIVVTNHVEHDPDIQHIPFFAISPKFFASMWSTYYKRVMEFDAFSKVMIGVQYVSFLVKYGLPLITPNNRHQIYYVVLSLARFNLYANSYVWLATKAKRTNYWRAEVAGVAFFWVWFGALLKHLPGWKIRVAYLLVSHIVTSPVHVQVRSAARVRQQPAD